jgi:hypothetical protein
MASTIDRGLGDAERLVQHFHRLVAEALSAAE